MNEKRNTGPWWYRLGVWLRIITPRHTATVQPEDIQVYYDLRMFERAKHWLHWKMVLDRTQTRRSYILKKFDLT